MIQFNNKKNEQIYTDKKNDISLPLCLKHFTHSLNLNVQVQAEDLSTSAGDAKPRETAESMSNEASVIVSTKQSDKSEDESPDKNLELRKDLTIEANGSLFNIEVEGLFKNEPHPVEVEVKEEDAGHQPSYVTLTTVSSGTEELADNANLVSNLSHLLNFNQTTWMAGHEDTSLMALAYQPVDLAPAHFHRNMVEVNGVAELSSYLMDDEYKYSIGPNPFYHLDTNNRRIWVPESCSAHRERSSRSPNGKPSVPGESIFVAEFESDAVALHQQSAVSIERFPSRSWRGPNSGKTQYEKGTILHLLSNRMQYGSSISAIW